MPVRLSFGGLAYLLVFGFFASALKAEGFVSEPPAGFRSLVDGDSLKGWHGQPMLSPEARQKITEEQRGEWAASIAEHWRLEAVDSGPKEIVNDGKGVYLTTDEDFGDFELFIQYKTVPAADSGIYLRGNPQVQIWDKDNESQWKHGSNLGSGGLWNNAAGSAGKDPLVIADKPLGEWNQFRILMVGERVSVWLNDQMVVDHARMKNYYDKTAPLMKSGPLQLQTHGGEIRWRSIFIRSIESEEANQILMAKNIGGHVEGNAVKQSLGFRPLFNGKDMAGWSGANDNYEVVDGSVQCKKGKGGVLYSDDIFEDFSLQVEFQLPPAGNNGIAIRYPGNVASGGDCAYVGMCELQVLDTEDPKYAKIDPRQAHGSVYGMVAAKRGFLRPVGEWNYQTVQVVGSKVEVELNGTRILDADLSTVSEYMNDKPHPGKDRTSGHIGLAGHSDPVRFRRIEVMPLSK